MKRSHRHIAMILQKDVADLGFGGELVDVRAGFARNFLLPGGHAVIATPKLREQHQASIVKAAAKREAEVAERQATVDKLQGEPIKLTLKTGPGGQVFGSITGTHVVTAVKAQHKIILTAAQLTGLPLKALGSHTVSAKLGLGVSAALPVEITGESEDKTDDADQPTKKSSKTSETSGIDEADDSAAKASEEPTESATATA